MRRGKTIRQKVVRRTDQRSPAVRLAALLNEPNVARGRRILQHIRADLASADGAEGAAPWLAAAVAAEAAGQVSREVLGYLVSLFIEGPMPYWSCHDETLSALSVEMLAIERAHGLEEGDAFYLDDAPDEWRRLNRAWDQRAEVLQVELLRANGLAEFADLIENSREELDALYRLGFRELWGEESIPRGIFG